MNIANVPADLQPRADPDDNSRTRGVNCEDAFLDYARPQIRSTHTYLPVMWWHCAVRHAGKYHLKGRIEAVPEVQHYIDQLDPAAPYFTVSRGDDGPYERLPRNTVVFGAAAGDIPIPLLCKRPTMKTANVPRELQTPRLTESLHRSYGFNIEEHVCQWFATRDKWIYLPVLWWNNAAKEQRNRGYGPVTAIDAVQAFVDSLPPGNYFTVSRGADGIYESVSDNVVVFSAGGVGDVPIPHLCEIKPGVPGPKNILASFLGNLECGGPAAGAPRGTSSWDPNGAGARVRRAMWNVFAGQDDCLMVNQFIGKWEGNIPAQYTQFREAAQQSWFGLAPRGYGRTSYRLYEMFYLGAIPVYIYDEPWLPYLDRIDWREIAVLCHVSELPGLPDRLRAIPVEKRTQMLVRAQSLLKDFFTPDGVCRQIEYYVGKL